MQHGFIGHYAKDKWSVSYYFNGCGWSVLPDTARVFVTSRGCKSALTYWREADHSVKHFIMQEMDKVSIIPVTLTPNWEGQISYV